MLTVSIQKDIGEYEEKVILGLTAKRFLIIGITCAVAILIGVAAVFVFHVKVEDVSLPIMTVAAVGFVVGFFKPLDMSFLDALPYLIRQNLSKNQLVYKSSADLALDEYGKAKAENARKNEDRKAADVRNKEIKSYRKDAGARGARSGEYLVPRYHAARSEIEHELGY